MLLCAHTLCDCGAAHHARAPTARRSENYSIDKRVGLGLWALPLQRSKDTTVHSWYQHDDDAEDDGDEDEDGSGDEDDDEDCTKTSPWAFMYFWGEKDPCSPKTPRPPATPDPASPTPPSLPLADGVAEVLEDAISDTDGLHHVKQRPSYYQAYEANYEAQLTDNAPWPIETLVHLPQPPSVQLTDHVGDLLKDEILGAK